MASVNHSFPLDTEPCSLCHVTYEGWHLYAVARPLPLCVTCHTNRLPLYNRLVESVYDYWQVVRDQTAIEVIEDFYEVKAKVAGQHAGKG